MPALGMAGLLLVSSEQGLTPSVMRSALLCPVLHFILYTVGQPSLCLERVAGPSYAPEVADCPPAAVGQAVADLR